MMRRKVIGLIGLGLLFPSYLGAGERPDREISQPEKKPIDLRQDVIKKEIGAFVSEYLNEGEKTQKSLRDAIKNHGLEKLVDTFSSVGFAYLTLARERVDNPDKYNEQQPEEKYQEISKDYLTRLGEVMKHTPVDYSKDEVRNCWALWIKLKTEFSLRLLSSGVNTEDYSKLVRKTFSVEEYRDFLKREIELIKNIYIAFYGSRKGIDGVFAGGDITDDRDFHIGFIEKKAYETYPEAKPVKEKPEEDKK